MKSSHRPFSGLVFRTTSAAVLALASSFSPASTVWLGKEGSNPIQTDGVKVVRMDALEIVFLNSSGSELHKSAADVQQLRIDGEDAFNDAEVAFKAAKWSDAADGYQKAVRATTLDWLRSRASQRLIDSAGKAGRFDAAVTGFIGLVRGNPELAAKLKPALPEAGSSYLDSAAAELTKSAADSKLTDAQKQPLLSFLLDIYRAKKDTAKVNEVMEQMVKIGAANPADIGTLRLAQAGVSLDTKNYQKALTEVNSARASYTDSISQTEALWIIARSQDGLLGDSDDAIKLKDLAIAYMRVVASAQDVPAKPHVPEALLRVAALHEKMKDPKTALQLYQQIASQFADQPAGTEAKTAAERLGKL